MNTTTSSPSPLGIIRSSNKALTVTSRNFEELRRELTSIYEERTQLLKQLSAAKVKLVLLSFVHIASFILIFGFFYKKISETRTDMKKEVEALKGKISETYVHIKFADVSQLEKSWLNCVDTYEELISCEKIWDLTYAEKVNKVRARSVADHSVRRTSIHYKKKELEIIKCDVDAIYIPNTNGPDIYIFPTFLILFKDRHKFGIFDLNSVTAELSFTGYHEEEKIPKDSEVVDYTWKKTNKNGSQDKRFKGNHRIPIVKYGSFVITAENGLQESYMFSDANAFEGFSNAISYHLNHLPASR